MQDLIHITVRPFGPAADLVGADTLEYALTPPATLGALVELLGAKYPRLQPALPSMRYAVNEEYADLQTALKDGDEVALIPPVSGGQQAMVFLTHDPLDIAALTRLVEHSSCGAITVFLGVVRDDESEGRALAELDYSAYESMALEQMERLRAQARERFEIHEVAIAHRLGRMPIGDASVAIVVSAAHRGAAFDACEWVIDTLKRDVPIWKKELWRGGEATWANA